MSDYYDFVLLQPKYTECPSLFTHIPVSTILSLSVHGFNRATYTVLEDDNLDITFFINVKGETELVGAVAGVVTSRQGTARKLLLYDPARIGIWNVFRACIHETSYTRRGFALSTVNFHSQFLHMYITTVLRQIILARVT